MASTSTNPTTTYPTFPDHESRQTSTRQIWRAGLISAAVAVFANIIVFAVVGALDIPLLFPTQGPGSPLQPMPIMSIVIVTLVPALIATALFALLHRFARRPVRWFLIVSAVVLLLSFLPTLSLPVPAATHAVLSLMHVVAAVPIVGGLILLTRAR